MARSHSQILRSLAVACALGLASVATLVSPFAPSVALAKSGGGNSGGHSGGNSGGNASGAAGNHDQSRDAARDASSSNTADRRAAIASGSARHGVSAAKTKAVARELGNLNAVHASATARAHAAPNSMVGTIARYDTAMRQALVISDPVLRAAAINAARADLAAVANKPLTGSVIARVDHILGLPLGHR